jgi:four helix bundle protein
VGANIAEGHGRHQGTEYIHYLIIARASANETEHWLHTAKDCGLGLNEKIDEALGLNNEVVRMITSSINTIREKKQVAEESADYLVDTNQINND